MSDKSEGESAEAVLEEARGVAGEARAYYERSVEINEEAKTMLSEARAVTEKSEQRMETLSNEADQKIEEWSKKVSFPWGDFVTLIRDYALTTLAIFGVLLAILAYVDVTPSQAIQDRGGYLGIFINEVAIGILLIAIAITILARFVMWVWLRRTSK